MNPMTTAPKGTCLDTHLGPAPSVPADGHGEGDGSHTTAVWAARGTRYLLDARIWTVGEHGFKDVIAQAWRRQRRLGCLCRADDAQGWHQPPGMYVARLSDTYILKRLPGTGHLHAPTCHSHDFAVDAGEGDFKSNPSHAAVIFDARTGLATLRLGFALSHTGAPCRADVAVDDDATATVVRRPDRLSLDGLLRLLWQEAELTRWHPGFEGRRHWGLVRNLLLLAASGFMVQGRPLTDWLLVPEPFSVEGRDEIIKRRRAFWAGIAPAPARGKGARLGLLIGELKAIEPMRFGARVFVKHMPEKCLVMDNGTWQRLESRHQDLLMAWSTQPGQRIIMATTVAMAGNGTPQIEASCLMATAWNWVPGTAC